MSRIQILWVDDEIELLKPHILFLERKNYKVTSCTNGTDAIDMVDSENFDIVFLDENMPGLSGLDTLTEIKQKQANLPIVMITNSVSYEKILSSINKIESLNNINGKVNLIRVF